MEIVQITFDEKDINNVSRLINKYCSKTEFICSSKDGESYEVFFTSSLNRESFMEEFKAYQLF